MPGYNDQSSKKKYYIQSRFFDGNVSIDKVLKNIQIIGEFRVKISSTYLLGTLDINTFNY